MNEKNEKVQHAINDSELTNSTAIEGLELIDWDRPTLDNCEGFKEGVPCLVSFSTAGKSLFMHNLARGLTK